MNSRRRGGRGKEQMNTVINFVPQQEAWVVERFGKFHDILEPGTEGVILVNSRTLMTDDGGRRPPFPRRHDGVSEHPIIVLSRLHSTS